MAHIDQEVNNETQTNCTEGLFSVDYPVMEKAMKTTIKVLAAKKPSEGREAVFVEESVTYSPDELTVVTRADAGLYTKRVKFTADGVEKTDYDHAYLHRDTVNVPVGTMQELETAIRTLSHKPKSCVIRGQLFDCYAELDKAGKVRRTRKSGWDEKNPLEWKTAFFVDVPRSWACIDIDGDKVYAKDGTFLANHEVIFPGAHLWTEATTAKEKATQVATWLVNVWMPSNFHHKDTVVQWSSSYALDGRFERVKAHVWVRLTKPLGVDVLGTWAQKHFLGLKSPDGGAYVIDMTAEYGERKINAKGCRRLDDSTVNVTVQPNYTSTPWFTDPYGKKIPDPHADYRVIRVNGNGAFGYAVDSDRIVEEFTAVTKKDAKKQAKTVGKTAYNPGGLPSVDNSDKAAQLSFDDWSAKDKSDYERAKLLLTYMGQDVDGDYLRWVRAGMAIKTRFPGQQGLDLWTQWSLTSEVRPEHEVVSACESKWPTFSTEGVALQKFGYLVARARELGMPNDEAHSEIDGAQEVEQSFFESDVEEIPGVGVASDATSYALDLDRNDHANGQRLYNAFGDRLRYISDASAWAAYMDGRWTEVPMDKKGWLHGVMPTILSYVVNRIGNEGILRSRRVEKAVEAAALRDGLDTAKSREKAKKAAAAELAKYTTWRDTSHKPSPSHPAMLYHLTGMPGVATQSENWDDDPMSICAPNGYVDLRTATIRPYDRETLVLRQCGASFTPENGHDLPQFAKDAVEAMMGRPGDEGVTDEAKELAEYVWDFLAYCLTGDTSRQKFVVWYGALGGNGKGTLQSMMEAILGKATKGGYYTTLNESSLIQSKSTGGSARPDLMGLIGARMAVVTEMTDDNSIKLDVGVIKAITGQDTLSYRQIYSTQTEFTPTCKLMMSCNTIPRFAADGGMSRRFEALPFERAFREVPMPDDPVDPHRPAFDPALRAKLIAAKDAIFTHLVFRAKALYDAGFKINAPHRVTDFSSATLDDMNPLRNFVDECCLRCDEFVTNAELRDSFSTWATRNRVQGASWSQHKLTTEMKRLSFQEARKTSARGFTGLRIQKHLLPQSPF